MFCVFKCIFIFFFKQKTAYEIYQCDWSSDVCSSDLTNYLGVRVRGNAFRSFAFTGDDAPGNKNEIAFPQVFSLFTAGTLTSNVGYFFELESNLELGGVGVERGFVTLNNLGRRDLAHLRIGRLDPSAFWSYPTHRQILDPVQPDVEDAEEFSAPKINRIPLLPNAFSAKFFGLFDREGGAILPFEPSLFNAVSEVAIDVHGRPFGDWFLYQVGVLNGPKEEFGDSNGSKDWYAMGRLDLARSNLFSASLSGFGYFGSNNARVKPNEAEVSWSRQGVAANVRYRMVDIYGAYVFDRVVGLPDGFAEVFDKTASGATIEADVIATDRLMLSARYDRLNAGGMRAVKKDNSIVGLQAAYYLRSNIRAWVRNDYNLGDPDGGTSPVRQFRNAFLIGADLAF